jgi:Rab GDP dissociation inhibitor
MLNQDAEEITYDADGKVTGIRCGDQTASAPLIICDPSYAGDKNLKPTNQIIRAICIMNHPIPDTNNASSVQVIIPAR